MELQETYFLHGISFAEELALLLIPDKVFTPRKRAELYISKINTLFKRLKNKPNIEVALGWVGIDVFRYISRHTNIRVIHAPFVDGTHKLKVQGKEIFADITEFNQENFDRLKTMLKLIAEVKNKSEPVTVIFHPVPYGLENKSADKLIQNIYLMLKKVCTFLADNNIFLTIENMPWLVGVTSAYTEALGRPEFFSKFFELCRCPNIGMTFDFGHANSMARYLWLKKELSTNELLSFKFPLRFTKEFAHKIFHVHFHHNPAHKPRSRPIISQAITKFKNYDVHNKVQDYTENEWSLIKTGFNDLMRTTNSLQQVGGKSTVTLEVAPRAVNSLNAYFEDMEVFKNKVMVKYQDSRKNKKNKLIKGKYGKHFKS